MSLYWYGSQTAALYSRTDLTRARYKAVCLHSSGQDLTFLLSRLRQEFAFCVWTKTDSQRDELHGRGLMGLASRCGFPGSIGGMTCCID